MFGTEFLFNGHSSREYGLTICGFDGDAVSVSGGDIEVNTVQAPGNLVYDYYGRLHTNVITWTFSVCKHPCDQKDDVTFFNIDEQRHVAKWLMGEPGYKEFCILQDNDEDIYYYCTANMVPHIVANKIVGFDITITANSDIGFSRLLTRKDGFADSKKIQIQVNSDLVESVKPVITFSKKKTDSKDKSEEIGNFTITHTDVAGGHYYKMDFTNIANKITIDAHNDIIAGLTKPSDFNYVFPYLNDGMNNFECTNPNVEMTIEYREIRKVIVV